MTCRSLKMGPGTTFSTKFHSLSLISLARQDVNTVQPLVETVDINVFTNKVKSHVYLDIKYTASYLDQ